MNHGSSIHQNKFPDQDEYNYIVPWFPAGTSHYKTCLQWIMVVEFTNENKYPDQDDDYNYPDSLQACLVEGTGRIRNSMKIWLIIEVIQATKACIKNRPEWDIIYKPMNSAILVQCSTKCTVQYRHCKSSRCGPFTVNNLELPNHFLPHKKVQQAPLSFLYKRPPGGWVYSLVSSHKHQTGKGQGLEQAAIGTRCMCHIHRNQSYSFHSCRLSTLCLLE